MQVYIWFLSFSFVLLAILFFSRSGLRKKYVQKAWVERLETIARDNHTLWATHLPYSQKKKLCEEVQVLSEQFSQNGVGISISESGEWVSEIDFFKFASVKRLFKKLLPTLTAYARTLDIEPRYLTLKAWPVLSHLDESFNPNSSKDALFSGCYFLVADIDHSSHPIHFYKKDEENQLLAHFFPKEGDLLLFPSDMSKKYLDQSVKGQHIAIFFDVYFGNREKSWLISKIEEMRKDPELDPFFEQSAVPNTSQSQDMKRKLTHFLPLGKIKKK